MIGIEKIKSFPDNNPTFLREVICRLDNIIKGKRRIMYSDIINLILREGHKDEISKELILWCNYKIRSGELFIYT